MGETTVKRLRVRLRANDRDGLLETFAPCINEHGVFVATKASLEPGTKVLVELLYSTGKMALCGKGQVVSRKPKGVSTAVQWSDDSKSLVDWIIEQRHGRESPASDLLAKKDDSDAAKQETEEKPSPSVDLASDLLAPDPGESKEPEDPSGLPDDLDLAPSREKFGDDVSQTAYSLTDSEDLTHDEIGMAPTPDALDSFEEDAYYEPTPNKSNRDSGEVTPLARIELVKSEPKPLSAPDIPPLEIDDDEVPAKYAIPSSSDQLALPDRSERIIAIDFGFSNCRAAIFEAEGPEIVRSRRDMDSIPSAVLIYDGGKTIVGDPVIQKMGFFSDNAIRGTTRLLGRPYASSVVTQNVATEPERYLPSEAGFVAVRLGEYGVSLEEISALLLKEIRDATRLSLGEQINCSVLVCPSFFGEYQRRAIHVAGELGGFHVERIISAPLAAAVHYGFVKRPKDATKLFVYNLGGAMFEAALVEIVGDTYRLLASKGDPLLGGDRFDDAIADLLVREIARTTETDPRKNERAMYRIRRAAEKGKIRLTGESTTIAIEYDVEIGEQTSSFNVELELSRSVAEANWEPLVERTVAICRDVCEQAGVSPTDVDKVIMLGGQSKTLLVGAKVRELFQKKLVSGLDPTTTVALGAAQVAFLMQAGRLGQLVEILPTSFSVGLPDGSVERIFGRGTALPARAEQTFGIEGNEEEEPSLFLFQGESDNPEENELFGRLRFTELPGRTTATFTANFSFSDDGLLNVQVTDDTKAVLATEIVQTTFEAFARLAKKPPVLTEEAPTVELPVEEEPAKEEGRGFLGWVRNAFGPKK